MTFGDFLTSMALQNVRVTVETRPFVEFEKDLLPQTLREPIEGGQKEDGSSLSSDHSEETVGNTPLESKTTIVMVYRPGCIWVMRMLHVLEELVRKHKGSIASIVFANSLPSVNTKVNWAMNTSRFSTPQTNFVRGGKVTLAKMGGVTPNQKDAWLQEAAQALESA